MGIREFEFDFSDRKNREYIENILGSLLSLLIHSKGFNETLINLIECNSFVKEEDETILNLLNYKKPGYLGEE